MFFHNFKYNFLILFKNKMLIFWTFAFPIILATLFNMAFSNIEKNEQLNTFDIAVIDNEEYSNDIILSTTLSYLADESNEDRLFTITCTDLENAEELLNSKEIIGFLKKENNGITVTVKENGINETILKYVTDEIIQTQKIMEDLQTNSNNSVNYEELYAKINSQVSYIKDTSPPNLSYTMIEYYTLIAMTCLYGGIIGMYAINSILANMSRQGCRVAVSPVKKTSLILSSTLAAFLIQLIGVALLFLYTLLVMKIDYGKNILSVILMIITGSLAGLSLGVMIASLFRTNENTKTGIIISITMLCSFLSGMMGITMKYIIDKNIPILNLINPANMITDGLYSLYYYDTMTRFYKNIISLLIFSTIMIIISIYKLRRQKYDSI